MSVVWFRSPIAILAKAEILAKKLEEDFIELIEKKKKGISSFDSPQEVSYDWNIPFPGFDSDRNRLIVSSSKDRDYIKENCT